MSHIVGIDLGTTNSLVAVFLNGVPRLIPNVHGEVLTPSVVGLLDDGRMVVGAPARELRVTRPESCGWAFKRLMGTDRSVKLRDKSFTAIELSSFVLRSLKEDAEVFLKESVTDAVITVPAYFNDHQRKATKQAGELAGLKVRRIINEPTAAALTYGFHDREAEKTIIVIDLGGGTFDVTLMEIFEGTLEIVATAGESLLGGEDFTDRIVATVLKSVGDELEQAEFQRPLLVARLRQECEQAKRALVDAEEVAIRIPTASGELRDGSEQFKLTRETFARAVAPLMARLQGPVGKVLRDSQRGPSEIGDVILVGGATRMPVVQEFARTYFSREPLCQLNPDEVVALGAAVQSALLRDDVTVSEMVLTDVCPFSLGVEVVKHFGNRMEDGFYTPVIHRNTTIPVSREEYFSTVVANQNEVVLRVFQGEARRTKDNIKLGELLVKGIPPGPAGQQIGVRFSYDPNGILEVEAYLPRSGQKFSTVLTNHCQELTSQEIEKALERLRKIKFYPREDACNRRLVLFIERVVGEISPHQRRPLEEALDAFESAMSSGDPATFESARQELHIILSSLGITYDGAAE